MIIVSTGTNGDAFDRLLEAAVRLETEEDLLLQHGPSSIRRAGAKHVDYLSFAEYESLVEEAGVVITHAGVGSVLLALLHGKRPVLMPRLARFGEAVDDHQLDFASRLRDSGLAELAEDADSLQAVVDAMTAKDASPATPERMALVQDLGEYLAGAVGSAGARGRTPAR